MILESLFVIKSALPVKNSPSILPVTQSPAIKIPLATLPVATLPPATPLSQMITTPAKPEAVVESRFILSTPTAPIASVTGMTISERFNLERKLQLHARLSDIPPTLHTINSVNMINPPASDY